MQYLGLINIFLNFVPTKKWLKMSEISRSFRGFVPQLLHMIVLPVFFFRRYGCLREWMVRGSYNHYFQHHPSFNCICQADILFSALETELYPLCVLVLCRNDFHFVFCSSLHMARTGETDAIFRHADSDIQICILYIDHSICDSRSFTQSIWLPYKRSGTCRYESADAILRR